MPKPSKVRVIDRYMLLETIGRGTYGKVKRAMHFDSRRTVAVKILERESLDDLATNQASVEAQVMATLDHRNVVKLHQAFTTKSKIVIVMELVDGGELYNQVPKDKGLAEDSARYYYRQLLDGLNHCHRRGVFHRDLKLENVLLDKDGCLKISDFGLSTLQIKREDRCRTQCGTPEYVAPEVFSGSGSYSGGAADVWSSGVVLYALVSGCLPFEDKTPELVLVRVVSGDWVMPASFSKLLKDLMVHLLDPDPESRYTLEEIRNHPWYSQEATPPPPGSLRPPTVPPTSAGASAAHASSLSAAPLEIYEPDDPSFPGVNVNHLDFLSTEFPEAHPDADVSVAQSPVWPSVSSAPQGDPVVGTGLRQPVARCPPEPTLRSGAVPPLPTRRPRSRGDEADLGRFQSAEDLGVAATGGYPLAASSEAPSDGESSNIVEPLETVIASTLVVDHMALRPPQPQRFGVAPAAVPHAPIAMRAVVPPSAPAVAAPAAAVQVSSAWQDPEDLKVGVAPGVPAAPPMFPASGAAGSIMAVGDVPEVARGTLSPTGTTVDGGWPCEELDDAGSFGGDQFDDAPADVAGEAGDAAKEPPEVGPLPWTLPPARNSPLAQAHVATPTAAVLVPVALPAYVLPNENGRALAPESTPTPVPLPTPLTIPSVVTAPATGSVGFSMGVTDASAAVAPVLAVATTAHLPLVAQPLVLRMVDLTAVVPCNACVGCMLGSACEAPEDIGTARFNHTLNSQWQQLVDTCLADSADKPEAVMAQPCIGAPPARPTPLAVEELRTSHAPDRPPSLPVSPSPAGAPQGSHSYFGEPGVDLRSTVSRHGRGSGTGSVRSRRSSVAIGEPRMSRSSSRHKDSSETGVRRHGRSSMDSIRSTQSRRLGGGGAPMTDAVDVSRDFESDGDAHGGALGGGRVGHPSRVGSRSSGRARRLQSGDSSVGPHDAMSPMTSGGIGGSQLHLTRDHCILMHIGKPWQDIDTGRKDKRRRPPPVSRITDLTALFPPALPDDGELIVIAGDVPGVMPGSAGALVPMKGVERSDGQPSQPTSGSGVSTGSDDVQLTSTGHAGPPRIEKHDGALQDDAARSPRSVQHSMASRGRRSHRPSLCDASPTPRSPHDERRSRKDRHVSRSGSRRSPRAGERGRETSRSGRREASRAGVSRRSSRRGSPDAVNRRHRSASRSRAGSRRRNSSGAAPTGHPPAAGGVIARRGHRGGEARCHTDRSTGCPAPTASGSPTGPIGGAAATRRHGGWSAATPITWVWGWSRRRFYTKRRAPRRPLLR
eukprot:TRINITY_DN76_c0_g1_i5.p1 TRINITY_DN76_c0_g1~~TRINITY_DN76_c0_g1_i5.p1  ORF type:complete len:1278 (+),score=116.52 TRINITY_DN76_c0_g1_i5:566-4399(+)